MEFSGNKEENTDLRLPRNEDVDVPDGCVPSSTSKSKSTPVVEGLLMTSEEYDMTHERRGVAVIFSHFYFKKELDRKGTNEDAEALEKQFTALGFIVRRYDDLTKAEVLQVLKDLSTEDHSTADCLVVCVLTHGKLGKLMASDSRKYNVEQLWEPFYADVCPSLATKPKLFFIQACRGRQTDDGVRVIQRTVADGPSQKASYTFPKCADILVAYSTFEGYYSWRDVPIGSWFIQALCMELQKHGTKYDILRILTTVNRRVAIEKRSKVPHIKEMDNKKQIPCFNSTLTRMLYFTPK